MGKLFRLLHVSDLHISASSYFSERGRSFLLPYRSRSLSDSFSRPAQLGLLKAVARAAFANQPLDAVMITGDLANSGDAQSLQAAYHLVTAEPTQGWKDASGLPTLHRPEMPSLIHLMPGNHDRFTQWYQGYGPGGTLFDSVFQKYWDVGQGVSAFVLGKSLGIVMADLTLTSILHGTTPFTGGFWGQGKAYVERIAFMKVQTELLRARQPDIAILWAVHFAPAFEGLDENLKLIDDNRLIEAAEDLGISHILCGHTHERRQYSVGKNRSVTIFCGGAASQRGAFPNTLGLFELEVEGGALAHFAFQVLEHRDGEGFRASSGS